MGTVYISNYGELSKQTGVCIPTLRKLVRRPIDPLPAVKVSPRKYVFPADQVKAWFEAEAERQAGGER